MPFFAVIPTTMMMPMNDEMFSVMPARSSPMKLPARHDRAPSKTASAGLMAANSHTSTRNIADRSRNQHQFELVKGLLLFGIQTAEFKRDSGRQFQAAEALLDARHRRAEVNTLDAAVT